MTTTERTCQSVQDNAEATKEVEILAKTAYENMKNVGPLTEETAFMILFKWAPTFACQPHLAAGWVKHRVMQGFIPLADLQYVIALEGQASKRQ